MLTREHVYAFTRLHVYTFTRLHVYTFTRLHVYTFTRLHVYTNMLFSQFKMSLLCELAAPFDAIEIVAACGASKLREQLLVVVAKHLLQLPAI